MVEPRLQCRVCREIFTDRELGDGCPHHEGALVPASTLSEYPTDTSLGHVFGGKYAVVGVLGQGSLGAVYLAVQRPVGREVALKLIRPGAEAPADSRQRFLREAKAIARLSHPAVVTFHDYGVEPGGAGFMVMERVTGEDLETLVEREAPLAPARAVAFTLRILDALASAHDLGLVHRDLKPGNIMVGRTSAGDEDLRLLDFGIAKFTRGADKSTLSTQQGVVIGTPAYLSPEQAYGIEVGPGADLYSMGVMLFEMLTGRLPYDGPSAFAVMEAHCRAPVPHIDEHLGVAPALDAVCWRAMQKTPEERFESARGMANALLGAVEEELPVIGAGIVARSSVSGISPMFTRTPSRAPGVGPSAGAPEPGAFMPSPSRAPAMAAPDLSVPTGEVRTYSPKPGSVALVVVGALMTAAVGFGLTRLGAGEPAVVDAGPVAVDAAALDPTATRLVQAMESACLQATDDECRAAWDAAWRAVPHSHRVRHWQWRLLARAQRAARKACRSWCSKACRRSAAALGDLPGGEAEAKQIKRTCRAQRKRAKRGGR